MTAILYPVAASAEAAIMRPLGRAARAREAQGVAGEDVIFVSEAVGPAYATREAALAANSGRVEDVAAEDRFCKLVETLAPKTKAPRPAVPVMAEGRRWPAPAAKQPGVVWRLSVSYWRIASAVTGDLPQARQARRAGADGLDKQKLAAMTNQPLRPLKAQQPLDIGLFERRLPESPHIIVPDE
jgi:hypothetical protein